MSNGLLGEICELGLSWVTRSRRRSCTRPVDVASQTAGASSLLSAYYAKPQSNSGGGRGVNPDINTDEFEKNLRDVMVGIRDMPEDELPNLYFEHVIAGVLASHNAELREALEHGVEPKHEHWQCTACLAALKEQQG